MRCLFIYLSNSPEMEGAHVFELPAILFAEETRETEHTYERTFEQALNWSTDQFGADGERWKFEFTSRYHRMAKHSPCWIAFYDPVDATAFRLRWC